MIGANTTKFNGSNGRSNSRSNKNSNGGNPRGPRRGKQQYQEEEQIAYTGYAVVVDDDDSSYQYESNYNYDPEHDRGVYEANRRNGQLAPIQDPDAAAQLRDAFRGLSKSIRSYKRNFEYDVIAVGHLRPMPVGAMRRRLAENGIHTGLIPSISMVGAMYEFIVSVDYTEVLIEAMRAIRATIIEDYNPASPLHIFPAANGVALSIEERAVKSREALAARLSRSYSFTKFEGYKRWLEKYAHHFEIELDPNWKPAKRQPKKKPAAPVAAESAPAQQQQQQQQDTAAMSTKPKKTRKQRKPKAAAAAAAATANDTTESAPKPTTATSTNTTTAPAPAAKSAKGKKATQVKTPAAEKQAPAQAQASSAAAPATSTSNGEKKQNKPRRYPKKPAADKQ
ncbi:hypothetical protein GQ42DRAFT_164030 [Ramicandelaber brevisporus]|nr:hypothetical protein GQ42DRAFT_164030 [Ramicandelaber brevisporus]